MGVLWIKLLLTEQKMLAATVTGRGTSSLERLRFIYFRCEKLNIFSKSKTNISRDKTIKLYQYVLK